MHERTRVTYVIPCTRETYNIIYHNKHNLPSRAFPSSMRTLAYNKILNLIYYIRVIVFIGVKCVFRRPRDEILLTFQNNYTQRSHRTFVRAVFYHDRCSRPSRNSLPVYIYIYTANVTLSWRTIREFQRVFVVCRFVPENDIKTRAASLGSNDHVMLVYKTNTCIIIHSETRVHERLSK